MVFVWVVSAALLIPSCVNYESIFGYNCLQVRSCSAFNSLYKALIRPLQGYCTVIRSENLPRYMALPVFCTFGLLVVSNVGIFITAKASSRLFSSPF